MSVRHLAFILVLAMSAIAEESALTEGKSVTDLLRELASEKPQERLKAATLLPCVCKKDVPWALRNAMRNPEAGVRESAGAVADVEA